MYYFRCSVLKLSIIIIRNRLCPLLIVLVNPPSFINTLSQKHFQIMLAFYSVGNAENALSRGMAGCSG